jgi:hypothetical protein
MRDPSCDMAPQAGSAPDRWGCAQESSRRCHRLGLDHSIADRQVKRHSLGEIRKKIIE